MMFSLVSELSHLSGHGKYAVFQNKVRYEKLNSLRTQNVRNTQDDVLIMIVFRVSNLEVGMISVTFHFVLKTITHPIILSN